MKWWNLPGPSRYVSDAASDLLEGKNVILWLPESAPQGLRAQLNGELFDVHLQILDCSVDENCRPLDLLFERYVDENHLKIGLRSITRLLESDSFLGHSIWLDNLSQNDYIEWIAFLEEYSHSCRNVDILSRSVFCLPIFGGFKIRQPQEDVCLSIRKYKGIVRPLDMRLYVAGISNAQKGSYIFEEVHQEIVASLAQWNVNLCNVLAPMSLKDILNEGRLLEMIRSESDNLNNDEEDDEILWAKGFMDIYNDSRVFCSSYLSWDSVDVLRHRIWIAQLRVLYPFIEEQRQKIIEKEKNILHIPFTTRFGETIESRSNLEIGHIEAQLWYKRPYNKGLYFRVRDLRMMRNDLAHMDIVSFDLLNSDAIRKPY